MQKAAPFRGGFLLEVQKIDGCVFVSVILERLSGAFLLNCELFALTLLFALPLLPWGIGFHLTVWDRATE